jgi:hypothetical protein
MKSLTRADVLKYTAAFFLLSLYIVASCLVVRSEGFSYRRSIRMENAANRRPSEIRPEMRGHEIEAVPLGVSDTKPAAREATPLGLSTSNGGGQSEEKVVVPTSPSSLTPALPMAGPGNLARTRDPLWDTPAMKEVWDLAHLSPGDERRLGQSLHELVMNFHKPLEIGPYLARIEEVAEPFLAVCSRKEIKYQFTVLNSDAVNAFSFPGGYIYVCKGVFDLIAEDEEYALQFLIGHEIAHVDLRHAMKCLQDPAVGKLGIGTLPQFYQLVLPLGYMEEMDFEADRWTFEQMSKFGRSRREALAFLRKFEGYAKTNGFENTRGKLVAEPDLSPIENHLRAHPLVRHRLKRLSIMPSPR